MEQKIDAEFQSKEEKAWNDIARATERDLLQSKITQELAEITKDYAIKRAKEEKEKFRKV